MGVQLDTTGGCASNIWSFFSKSLTDNYLTRLFKDRAPKEDHTQLLPLEIKVIIVKYCDQKSLLAMRTMSKEWQSAVQMVKDVKIHPLAWAIITKANITLEDNQLSIKYISKGPGGLGRDSTLTFIKSEGTLEITDPQALLQGYELSSRYYLSPFWIFHEMVNKKRVWKDPSLNDEKGKYFKKLVKGIKCPLQHTQTRKFGPDSYFIQSQK